MTTDASWNRVKALFQEAIERPPIERQAFLRNACGGDATLHQEVESLLTAHAAAGDFAERPAMDVMAESSRGSGPYQLLSLLGAGGMGEVYRARDTTLGRDVAIKILPPIFSVDPDRLARFDREARLLASLSHPNVCAIHGIADINGAPGLVLELVEGRTLAERIAAAVVSRRTASSSAGDSARKSLAITEALTIARDIARALEAAHDKGIIHRDLKPANIKITPDGIVKVLDFGLAKASAESASERDRAQMTGVTTLSGEGMLLGTAAYMSPEQARGEPLDKRTDIWSFGCVLYEMLTGRRAAEGATVSDTIAAVLEHEPDWAALPPATSPTIQRLLRRCLEKDVKRRLRDIGDARLEIEEALASPVDANALHPGGAAATRRTWYWPLAGAAVVAAVAVLSFAWLRPAPRVQVAALRRVSTEFGTDASLVTFQLGQGAATTLSPDGALLAFVAERTAAAARQIYVRRLDQLQATPLVGTDGALNPFFSPDSQWIAFFADGKLKTIPAAGGGAVTICSVLSNRGGTWGENGQIVFSPDRNDAALWQVSSKGGEPTPLIALGEGETTQRWPQWLRGGTAVLFTGNNRPDGFEAANVVVQSLPNGPRTVLVSGAYYGRYLPSGHLIYVQNATLFAAPFDLDRLALTGPAVPVLAGATMNTPVGAAEIAVSDAGTLAYLPVPQDANYQVTTNYLAARVDWLNRDGEWTPLRTTPERWLNPQFSPDGGRLALTVFDGAQNEVWTYDWSRDASARLTFDPGEDNSPVWSPNGRRIVFSSTRRSRAPNLYWQREDGAGEAQRLTESDRPQAAGSWHPTEPILAFTETDPQSGPTVMLLRLEGNDASGWRPAHPTVFMTRAADPKFSPDGRWLAYVGREPGRDKPEVYVQAFPGPGGRRQISTDGGNNPAWSRARQEFFYATLDHRIVSVSYTTDGDSFHVEKSQPLPNSRFSPRITARSFDVHPDGNRFALVKAPDQPSAANHDHVVLIFNFLDELRRIAPPAR